MVNLFFFVLLNILIVFFSDYSMGLSIFTMQEHGGPEGISCGRRRCRTFRGC